MTSAPGAERLAIARSEVKRACNLLIAPTPEALTFCQDALRRAVSGLTEFPIEYYPEVPAELATPARALRAEVLRAGRLLQSLASFYQGWERILGAMSGGYTPNGDPVPVARLGRLSCRG